MTSPILQKYTVPTIVLATAALVILRNAFFSATTLTQNSNTSTFMEGCDGRVTTETNNWFSKASHKATEIIDETCSFIPESIKEMDFPLHRTSAGIANDVKQMPLVWLFESGVMLKTEYLNDRQMNRFWSKDQRNIWEVTDEPLMMKAVGDLYHRCEAGEECVFVDGGAAFGYYTQMIRLHYPLVKVLAFNPHPKFVEQMIDNLSLAKVHDGVCLQQKGLSNESGSAKMGYGVSGRLGNPGTDTVEVQIVTLDEYYDDFGKGKLFVAIKLDVEGFGGNVVRGSPKMMNAAQNVFIGVHNKDEQAECENLKQSAGLTILDKSKFPSGFTPNDLCVATRNQNW